MTVLELIRTVSARGVSVILITHRLQDLFRVCGRLTVMYEGTVRADLDAASTSLDELVAQRVVRGGQADGQRDRRRGLQRIVGERFVVCALATEKTAKQREVVDGKWRGGKRIVALDEGADARAGAGPEAGEGDMRLELAPLRHDPGAHDGRVPLVRQPDQVWLPVDADPQGVNFPARLEASDVGERQRERRRLDPAEAFMNILGVSSTHCADKTKRDVHVLWRHPSGSRDAGAQAGETGTDHGWEGNADEQAEHGQPPWSKVGQRP